MNIIELQDNLKDLPDRALVQEMQMPTGNMPQFLVLSELTRRRRMRDEYNRQKAADMPTVAEEVMTASGVPQGGITAIARNMAPNSSIAQNTGADMAVQREPTRMPQMMADGGILNLFRGGRTREDMYTQVEPYPENDPDFRKRRDWNLRYGMTHNLDGSPKRMSPSTVDFDAMSDDISDAEQSRIIQQEVINNNIPELGSDQPFPGMPQADPETNLDISGALGVGSLGQNLADAMNNPIGDLPFLPPPTRDVREPSSSTDATIGSYGRTTVGQTKDEIERMNQILDLAGIGPDTESDVDMIDLMGEALDERGGYQAAADAEANQEAIANLLRSTESEMLKASGAMDASYPQSQEDPMPLPDNVPDQSGFIPEMPIGSDSVMPPLMNTDDVVDTGSGAVSDSYSGLESRIAQMLADREKAAESDKYLALAQAGLALMASDSPTLGGAIGEAGLVGIGQLRDARSQYDKDVLELLSTQADIDSARADRNLQLQELALERDELAQTKESQDALSKYRMASLDPRNASISDLQAGLNYINGEIQTQATTITYDEVSGEEIEKIDMTKVDPQLLVRKKSLEDSLLTRLGETGADFDATGS